MSKKTSASSSGSGSGRLWPFNFFGKDGKGEKIEIGVPEKKSENFEIKKTKEASMSNITKAKQVISEIEAIIQKELSLMSEENLFTINEDGNSAVPSKPRKRPAPKLIRPLNKKKNRIIIGEMEFDPIKNVWVGNEKELGAFQRPTPALISKVAEANQQQRIGDMVFDPVEKVWRGNERELNKFKTGGPELIPPQNAVDRLEQNGMVFDPENMVWTGNDDELDIFGDIEKSEDERGFTVGKEFSLSQDVINSFMKCEQEHNTSLQGWCSAKEVDPRKHLYSIRNMSLIRIINQAKNGFAGPAATPNSRGQQQAKVSGSPFASRGSIGSLDLEDEMEGPGTSANPRKGEDDWESSTSSPPTEKEKKPGGNTKAGLSANNRLLQFAEKDDEFDQDLDISVVSKIAEEGQIGKEGKDESRSGTRAMMFGSDEDPEDPDGFGEDLDGLDVPSSSSVFTLKRPLTTNLPPSQANNPLIHNFNARKPKSKPVTDNSQGGGGSEGEDWGFEAPSTGPSLVSNLTPQKKEVVEEVWPDVDIPIQGLALGQKPEKSGSEDLADLVLPQEGNLVLSRRTKSTEEVDTGEEEWSDIDFSNEKIKNKLTLKNFQKS